MRDGIFTEIKRAANPVTISQVARNGLLIGPPVRVEKKQKLFTWITEGTILKLNVPSTGTVADYAISQKLKMADTDLIAAKEDLKLYLSKADGTDEIILAEAASTTVGELKKGVGTAFLTEYNDITTPDNTILTMDKEMGWLLKMDCDTDKTVDIALYSGELYTISDAGAHTQIADNIDSVAVGDTFVQPARADVAITGFAELSAGVSVTCTSAAHGLTSEDTITISGTALAVFDGIFVVTVLTDATFSILTAATAGVETGVFATAERYAKITSIDTSTNEIVVRKISTDFQAETALTGWNIYYDYFGSTTGDQRNPLIKYSIEALRPSVSGRHYISSIEDITDLFGAGSIDDADSILAYDAYYYYLTSNTKFTIYVMEVNTTTPESGQTMSINTTAIATALGKMNALTGYFIVPCYRVSVAADIATIESILETVLAWTNTRSSINSKKEGRVYGALPILNRGYGYTAANIVTIPALDLSDSKTSIYIDCGTDPQEDVDAALGKPATFGDDRMTLVPFYAYIGTTLIEGSTVAAIIAGERCALSYGANLAYGRTNDPVSIITSMPSIEYYTDTQLDSLKDAGWQMIVQKTASDTVKIYHQSTTNIESIELMEEHLVIAVDALCQDIRNVLAPYWGRGVSNQVGADTSSAKTTKYLAKLNAGISGLRALYVDKYEIFETIRIISTLPNSSNSDQVDVKIALTYYYPVNRVNIEVYA